MQKKKKFTFGMIEVSALKKKRLYCERFYNLFLESMNISQLYAWLHLDLITRSKDVSCVKKLFCSAILSVLSLVAHSASTRCLNEEKLSHKLKWFYY